MHEQRDFCSFCEEVLICTQAHSLRYMTLPLKIKQTKKTRTHWTWPKALSVLSAVYKYVIRYSTCNCQNCVIETSSIHTAGLITSWFSSNFTCYTSGVFGFITLQKNPVPERKNAENGCRLYQFAEICNVNTHQQYKIVSKQSRWVEFSNFTAFVFSQEIFEINVTSV